MTKIDESNVIDFVVRPPDVWNTRAPFHFYLEEHRNINRHYCLTSLILKDLGDYVRSHENTQSKKYFRRDKNIQEKNILWNRLKLSFPLDATGQRPNLLMGDLDKEIGPSLQLIRSSCVVYYVSLFETYFHSWVLNYLLAILENGNQLSEGQMNAATLMSPMKVHNRGPKPSWIKLVNLLPEIESELFKLPHIFHDPETGNEVTSTANELLNALSVMRFWREYRNLCVHNDSIVSTRFYNLYSSIYDSLRKSYSCGMLPLQQGEKLHLLSDVFPSVCTVHYRTALWLNDLLEKLSNERRGHPFAPKKKPKHFHFSDTFIPELMLIDGDHQKSIDFLSSDA